MKHIFFVRIAIMAMALSVSSAQAQNQTGILWENLTEGYQNKMYATSFEILDYTAPGCFVNDLFHYSIAHNTTPWGTPSSGDVLNFPSLPGGDGTNQFTIRATYKILANGINPEGWDGYVRQNPVEWDMYVDGQLCEDCIDEVVVVGGNMWCGSNVTQEVTFTHNAGNGWINDGIKQISLRPKQIAMAFGCFQVCTDWCPWPFDDDCCDTDYAGWTDYSTTTGGTPMEDFAPEFRFNAVFTGLTFTDIIGTFDTPQVLTCILRDPPGDQSFGEWTESTTQCFGTSTFGGTGTESSQWAEVTVGIGGSFLGFDYEVYASGGVNASISNELSTSNEYLTCIESTQSYTTGDDDVPDDLFIGSSLTYVYGMGRTVYWEGCVPTYKDGFAMRPVSTNSTFALTESVIRQNRIPALEAEIATLQEFSDEWEDATNQLNQWQQALDLNDEIKAEATGGIETNFTSTTGGATSSTITTTTSQTKTIDMKVRLSEGLSYSYGSSIGCCSVDEGGEFNISTQFGSTSTASNVWTNTMSYSLGDDDVVENLDGDTEVDEFYVRVMPDPVFGSYVFSLVEDDSRTSCPYEGGYQIEQPRLWVGSTGQTEMTINNVPLGSDASFPIILCNDSDVDVEYRLSANALTNDNAELFAFGINLINTDYPLMIPANGGCATGNLLLSQLSIDDLDFEDIEIQLNSGCDDNIKSTVLISAYFDNSVGVDDLTAEQGWFTVQPNPSTGQFRLTAKGENSQMTFKVTDLTGRTIQGPRLSGGSDNIIIDLSQYSSGMYILIAEKDGQQQSTRLMLDN